MRLPFLQVHQDVFAKAPLLASLLRLDRQKALGMLVELWRFALEWAREEEMPDGVVSSKDIPRTIAAACSWEGDAQVLLDALIELRFLEVRSATSCRVRGMSRYVKVIEDAKARKAHAKTAAEARWKQTQCVMPEHCPSNPREVLDDAQHNATQKEAFKPAAEILSVGRREEPKALAAVFDLNPKTAPAPEPPESQAPDETYLACWQWMLEERAEWGRPRELRPPPYFERWYALAFALVGAEGVQRAYRAFLGEETWVQRRWATAIFITEHVWSSRTDEPAPQKLAYS